MILRRIIEMSLLQRSSTLLYQKKHDARYYMVFIFFYYVRTFSSATNKKWTKKWMNKWMNEWMNNRAHPVRFNERAVGGWAKWTMKRWQINSPMLRQVWPISVLTVAHVAGSLGGLQRQQQQRQSCSDQQQCLSALPYPAQSRSIPFALRSTADAL